MFCVQVLTILTSSKDLLDLMKTMDIAFHSKQAGSGKSRLNSLYRFVTPIREQLNVEFLDPPFYFIFDESRIFIPVTF